MGGASLPPGFRFHPTDEELIGYYLKRKVEGLEIELEVIPIIDFYKYDPWELPDKSFLPKRDMEWFFFCPRDRKYPNGSRTNRATKAGYWKGTGKDRKITCHSSCSSTVTVTGYRKTLVFYRGRAPLGDRTDWIMHEFRLSDDLGRASQGAFALCRVMKKNDSNGKSRGVSNTIINENVTSMKTPISQVCSESRYSSPIDSPCDVAPAARFEQASMNTNPSCFLVSPDMILDSSQDYSQIQIQDVVGYFPRNDSPSTMTSHTEISPSSSFSNFNGEVEFSNDLSRIGCMSPYLVQGNFMEFYGNEDIPFEAYDQINSGCLNWNEAPIYLQTNDDGSSEEQPCGLWSGMIVM